MDYRGLAAPIDKSGGGYFAPAYLENLIWSSIWILLFTPLGSMPGMRDLGTSIVDFLFENVVDFMMSELQSQIEAAISMYEPRVTVQEVLMARREDELIIRITLLINRSSSITERTLIYDKFGNISFYT